MTVSDEFYKLIDQPHGLRFQLSNALHQAPSGFSRIKWLCIGRISGA